MKLADWWRTGAPAIKVTVFLVALILLGTYCTYYVRSGGDPIFLWNYQRVTIGGSKDRVVDLLGQPDESGPEFRLSQYLGFEDEYQRAEGSGSSHYLFWHRSIDLTYAIGFNEDNQVTLKAVGGT